MTDFETTVVEETNEKELLEKTTCESKDRKVSKKITFISVGASAVVCIIIALIIIFSSNSKYDEVLSLIEAGNNKEAYSLLMALDPENKDYDYLLECMHEAVLEEARQYYLDGDAAKASDLLSEYSITNDTQKTYECFALIDAGNNKEAYSLLKRIDTEYKDYDYLLECIHEAVLEEARQYYLDRDAAKASDLLLEYSITNDTQKAYECVAEGDYKTAVQTYGLVDIVIPKGVTSIGNSVFSDCSSLASVSIPYSVTSIGEYAFYNCTGLKSINIPNGVTSIGEKAFYSCKSLKSISIPGGVTSIVMKHFIDVPLSKV